jgi:transcriptional regulator with XRE-family HTH domain
MSKQVYSQRYQAFLRKLKQAREQKGLTQKQVAELLGKPQSFVSKCESGERRVDFVELLDFVRIYEVPQAGLVAVCANSL